MSRLNEPPQRRRYEVSDKTPPHVHVSWWLDRMNRRLTGQGRGSTALNRNEDHLRFGIKTETYSWSQYDDAGSAKKTTHGSRWLHIHLGRWTYTRVMSLRKNSYTPFDF